MNGKRLVYAVFASVWVLGLGVAVQQGGAALHREAPFALVTSAAVLAASALAAVFARAPRRDARVAVPGPAGAAAVPKAGTADDSRDPELRRLETMAAVGRVADHVAHDLGDLLNVISGYAQLAQRKLPADHECRRHLEEILRAAARGSDLTREVLGARRELRPADTPRLAIVRDAVA